MAVLYHENGKLQRAYFPSRKDYSLKGSLHVIKSVRAIGQLYTYSDMYEFWNVIFVENSEESAVMRYTAEYGGLS